MNIILIGMPGCGKTTLGKKLAQILDFDFLDCDEEIEKKESTSIPQIFKKHGEAYFRRLETETIRQLSGLQNMVISTGGGVVESSQNIDNLKKLGILIFIDRSPENIKKDIDASSRPLIKNKNSLEEIYSRRYNLYKSYCDIEVKNNHTLESALAKIIEEVKEYDKQH